MKKSGIFYIIFCVSVIVALAVFLVVKSNFDKSNKEGDTPTVKYATSMELNCDENYSMPLGSKLTFSDYISVSPEEFKYNVAYSLLLEEVEYQQNVFANDTFAPTEAGHYKIKCTLPKSANEHFVKVINVDVADPIMYEPVKIKKSSLKLNDEVTFDDMFDITLLHDDLKVEVSDNLTYENRTFVAKSVGEANIKIKLSRNHAEFEFDFTLTIDDVIPELTINVTGGTLNPKKTIYTLTYSIQSSVPQVSTAVNVQLSSTEHATLNSNDDPIIKLDVLSEGSVDVTLTSVANPSVSITVSINLVTGEFTVK